MLRGDCDVPSDGADGGGEDDLHERGDKQTSIGALGADNQHGGAIGGHLGEASLQLRVMSTD